MLKPSETWMAPVPGDVLMKSLHAAIVYGLGDRCDMYTLIYIEQLSGPQGAGVAYSLDDRLMYVLVGHGPNCHHIDKMGTYLIDLAIALSSYFQTLVVPERSGIPTRQFWGDGHSDRFMAYRFILADEPTLSAF